MRASECGNEHDFPITVNFKHFVTKHSLKRPLSVFMHEPKCVFHHRFPSVQFAEL
jgi:hypothetical protein